MVNAVTARDASYRLASHIMRGPSPFQRGLFRDESVALQLSYFVFAQKSSLYVSFYGYDFCKPNLHS
jgi:hypothetical protein